MLPFLLDEIESTLTSRFEWIARTIPDHPAVVEKDETCTYAELNKKANRLARAIVGQYGTESEPVALLCTHGLSVLIGILAVLKSGKFYKVISNSLSETQKAQSLHQVQARLLITDSTFASEADSISRPHQLILNLDSIGLEGDENIPFSLVHEMPAALFYTSGSTGEAKGVMRGHRMLLHHYRTEIIHDQIGPGDRLSFIHDCAYAGSTAEIFRGLLAGATLLPFDVRSITPSALIAWLQKNAISCFKPPIPLFLEFVEFLPAQTAFPHLRLVCLGGEKVYMEDCRKFWRKITTTCLIRHAFSASETGLLSIDALGPDTQLPDAVIPAGFPIQGKTIRILNEAGEEVPAGENGEIVVTSRYIAVGYWGNPELTNQRFQSDPTDPTLRTYATGDIGRFRSDGRLEHLGRKDYVVKVRGLQVNLRDVEVALNGIDGIREAAVVAYRPQPEREVQLAAYLYGEEGQKYTPTQLRQQLGSRLPDHMIPSYFTWLEQMPLTPTGKIDRKGLPAPDRSRPDLPTAFAAAQTPIEKELVQIWQETLGLDGIGIHDRFLDLGGHSLNAIQIVSRLLSQFQVEIPLPALFASPTVAEMALVITAHQMQLLSPEELDRVLNELKATNEIAHLA